MQEPQIYFTFGAFTEEVVTLPDREFTARKQTAYLHFPESAEVPASVFIFTVSPPESMVQGYPRKVKHAFTLDMVSHGKYDALILKPRTQFQTFEEAYGTGEAPKPQSLSDRAKASA